MGVEDRYKKKREEEEKSNTLYNGVENRYLYKNAETVGKEISNRVNKWLTNNKYYISNAQHRFSGNNTTFRTDASDWLTTVTSQRENFQKEAESIKSVLTQYKDFFGDDYVNSVFKALDGNLKAQESVLDASTKDVEYWSQWTSEDEYYTAQRILGYQNKYDGKSYEEIVAALGKLNDGEEKEWLNSRKYDYIKNSPDYDNTSASGWETYLSDDEKDRQEALYGKEDEKWYETLGRWLGSGGAVDTTLPLSGTTQVTHDLRNDTSYMEPANNWTDEQKAIYGYLYETDKGAASAYAQSTTEGNNQKEKEQKITAIEEWATKNGFNSAVATLASIALMPMSLVDTLSALTEYNARGFVSTSADPMPGEISNAITGAISNVLNGVDEEGIAHSVLNENIPVIGGKGLGDAYQLGVSIANSMLSAYTQGTVGTYMVFFGSASASGMHEAKKRGATDDQAITYGVLSGLAEAAGEAFSVEKLLSIVGAKELKGFFANVLKQAGIEASEEGMTTVFNNLADQFVMGDKSNFNAMVQLFMTQEGLSEEEAKKKAWHSMADDLIFDMLGGAISGGVSGGIQSGIGAVINSANDTALGKEYKEKFGADIGGALAAEAVEIDPNSKFAQSMQNKVESGNSLSNRQIGKLVRQNEAAMYENDVAAIQSAAENRLTELGEKGNVKAIATALTKQVQGERLTFTEREVIKSSTFGQRVANELNTKNINSGEYSTAWAEQIGTDRINAEEYGRLLQSLDAEASPETATAQAPINAQNAAKTEAPASTVRPTNAANPAEIAPGANVGGNAYTARTGAPDTNVGSSAATERANAPETNVGGKTYTPKADMPETNVGGSAALEKTNAPEANVGSKDALEKTNVPDTNVGGKATVEKTDVPDTNVGHNAATSAEAKPAAENAQRVAENTTAKERPSEAKFEASDEVAGTEEKTVTLEDASKKYGAQAGAMVATYADGQNVAKYDAAYSAAYNMGKSGVALSYAMNSEATAYLTENQRELAHAAGADASSTMAKTQADANKARANGKTGHRKGTVRGEGVKIDDLRKAFNDTQGKAYKLLTTYAEATGIDIVLYQSKANADGKFEGAQGKFKWSEDTIYIDINAGIADVGSVDDLAKYTMLRTFSHEFTHFIEKWNPVWYNEFRKVVFDTLTERGENVEALIETKQAQNEGMTYDKASREVVAEAMTDILPDANFVEELANNHKTIFDKLLEKLKEFVADLKAYFSSLNQNSSREANALKEQIGESVKYVENIVKLFDKVAVEAVTNYQATVATEEATVSKTEQVAPAQEVIAKNATTTETEVTEIEADGSEFTITDNREYGTLEIKFEGKPSEAIRDVLKENGFRWHRVKQVWYGKGERDNIVTALREAYQSETTAEETAPETAPTTEKTATETLREMGGKAVGGNMTDVTDLFFPELAKPATPKTETAKPVRTKKSDWAAHDVEWFIPGKKNPIAYSTVAASDLIEELSKQYPSATISQLLPAVNYDVETKKVLQQYIDAGYGDQIANEWFNHDKKENANVENVDNAGAVQQPDTDRQGDPRVLDEVEAGNVQGDAPRGDSVGDPVERGQQTVRDDLRSDAAGTGGGSSEGNREIGDLRRNDELTPEAERLHEEVTEQIAQQSTEQPKGRNFVIGDSLDLPNGEKSRYQANVEAIKLVKQLETEGRYATEAEQVILSKYVGWGGLANVFDYKKDDWSAERKELKELLTDEEFRSASGSTTDAFYTDIPVIKAMYDGLAQLGFNGGRMLEPSSGVGNFVGAMPTAMSAKVNSWTMVELDRITGLIAKYLYPNADVRIQGFEKFYVPDNYMDVAIGNVPFGNVGVYDKAYPKRVTKSIHNYFFAKALDKVRPGGIVMFITSSGTMNSSDQTVRNYIMSKADLLGAIRLPNTAFKGNAGTNVVSDILVLKKRAANTEYAGEDFLSVSYDYKIGETTNDYFAKHPEMVLGVAELTSGRFGRQVVTYKPFADRGSLADQIHEAFSHIKGKMEYPATLSREKTNFAVERANKKTKENGLVVKDGKVYQNKGGELVEVEKAKGAAERITGMLEIRDLARNLMNYQQQGLNETEIKKARTALNKAYDAFVKKYGFINAQTNKNAFKEDPDCFALFALENWNPDTKQATKADIFSKNTIAPNRTVTTAKDVSEGLIVSVNQTGGVDTALIAKLTGKTEADVTRELIDSRKAFKNRNGDLEAAETYLSGNVRAKLRDAEALAPIDSDYANNVEALKAVMPADVGYQDIFVNPGTPWIPNSVYSDFAAYMLEGRNTEYRQVIDVTRNAETGNFTVELKEQYFKHRSANTQKWGTSRRTFLELFDAMLNSKSVVIKDKLDDGSFVINKDATAAANEKIENIQKEFQDWLWRDEARRTELATLYNEVFNSVVTPKYNGKNLTVNGMNAEKSLRPHQKDAVQRVISSGGNTLLAHKVGAGKTYEMAAAAMKLKELGLVKKPMFAVPKSLVAQWGKEFLDIFPTAKLLVAEASDFTASNRKVFMNRVANGEYDAVIVSYEQFEKLPMSDDFTRQLYQEQIDSVIAAIEEAKAEKKDKSLSVKDLEKKRKSLQTKIDKLTDKAKDEGNIDFEQLGVDALFVDEAHNFKNLFYTTSMTNVAGLGNKDGSKRAFDLYTKVRYLQKLNGGRGIVFATATPVMNSMSEMYIMQKYLQPDLLNQLGLNTFDAWAKQFGEVVNGVEIKPSGQGYRVKQSFSRFKNMSELQLLFRNFADVLTEIPDLKIPKMKGGKVNVVVCEPGQFQQDFMKELEQRADNIKNVDPSVDNMLKITSDGRKISYTQRMIDPSLPYEEGCKIYRCADNVIKEYNDSKANKGTQIIFCDMATPKGKSNNATETEDIETDMESAQLYDDLKTRLRQGGIPAKEIAFIHEADTDAKKKKLFEDVNDGKVRVLIGSTGKMGVGMNAQKRIVAIHHLDAPWRPGDVEQRDGRAFRQKNMNDEVSKYTYVTEGSFDARLWDILDRKQNFINQIMNGENMGRDAEDTGEVTLSAAEVKALASGSPLIMEQVQLDTDIKKLESLYRAHTSAVFAAKERLTQDHGQIALLEKQIANGEADMLATVDTYSEGKFSMTVGNNKYADKKEAGVALVAAAGAKATAEGYTKVGSFAGFELRVGRTNEGVVGLLVGKQGYPFKTYPGNPTYMTNHLIGVVESIEEKVKLWRNTLAELQKDIAAQEKLIAEPFAKQAELDQKRARYIEVMDILNPKEEQSLDSVAEDTVQEQSREYLGGDEYFDEGGTSLNADAGMSYNVSAREYSLKEVANMYHLGNLGSDYDALFNKSYAFCENSGIQFEVVSAIRGKNGGQAPGASIGNKIKLNQSQFNRADLTNNRKSQTILHEMLHSSTVYAITAYNMAKEDNIVNELPKHIKRSCEEFLQVYEAIRNDSTFENTRVKDGVEEMVAELANPNFVKDLKLTYPSLWHKLLDTICEMLGINKRFTNYDKLRRAAERILSDPDFELAQGYYEALQGENPTYLDESQYSDVQEQQRTTTLNDREVLALAADALEATDLTDAERDALQIFRNRLTKLEELQDERKKQGALYKEQQFGTKVDREAAAQTLNRMQVLDEQIKKAKADVLSLEDKKVLGDLLKKARKVVEVEQRSHDAEILKRYRDRTKNAAAIKKYRDRITADVDDLYEWLMHPMNKDVTKHVNENVKDIVIDFLLSIDQTSGRRLRGGEATKADEKHDKKAQKLLSMLNGLDEETRYSGEYDLPLNFESKLARHVKTVQDIMDSYEGDTVLNQMTAEELQNLSIVTANLKAALTTMNKFHTNAMFAHVTTAGDNTVRYLKKLRDSDGNEIDNFIMWKNIRPDYVWDRFGDGGRSINLELRAGQDKLAWNAKSIVDYAQATFTEKEREEWENAAISVTLSGDREIKVTAAALMSFYELSKRKQGREHILNGGVTVSDVEIRENKKKQRVKGRYGKFTEADIDIMKSKLTDRQKEVADKLQQFMEKQGGEWGNHVTLARFGEKAFGEKGYFPISVDKQSLNTKTDDSIKGADLYRLLNMGFTKELSSNTKQPLMIYSIFDVFSTHMADMAQYNAMALPVLDAIRWLNYKNIDLESGVETSNLRAELKRAFGAPLGKNGDQLSGYAESFIAHILQAYNGTEARGTPEDAWGVGFMHRYNRAQIAYNMRVVVQQPMALTRAALVINPKYITKALDPTKLKANIEDMLAHSGIAVWKDLGYYDINISRGLTQMIKQDETFLDKVTEIGMKPAELADKATWAVMWYACKLQLADRGITDYEQINKLFDDVIYKTQVVDSVLTKSQYMRDKGFWARTASAFMSEPVTTASMVLGAYDDFRMDLRRGMNVGQAWNAHKTEIGKMALVYSVSAIMLAMVQAAADALRDDDDYQNFLEKWYEAFKGNIFDELTIVNKIPLVSYAWDLLKIGLDTFTDLDVYGNTPGSALTQWFDALTKLMEIVNDKRSGESNYTWYAMIYKLLQVASGASGLPAAAGLREVATVWNNTFGVLYPDLKLKTYDPGDMSEIKYAYADGYLTFDEAAAELLDKGLVENEDEAYFTISGWEAGDGYSRYDKVYEAVRTGASIDEAMNELVAHGYTEKDVISQLKTQIGRWYYDDKSDYRITKQQATDMLTKYTDMTDEEITKKVNEWSSKVVTGIDYGDIDDEYMAGNITASRAIEMYMRYGGMTKEDATNKVSVYTFIKEHPSLSEENISYSFVSAYNEYCEPQGIDVDVFHDVWRYMGSAESDKDKHGKVIPDSKKQKVLAYVDSLELSRKQKDALYYALGYAKSTIKDAPWR